MSEHETTTVSTAMVKAIAGSEYGMVPYDDVLECMDPVYNRKSQITTESFRDETDVYWPPDTDDPINDLFIPHTVRDHAVGDKPPKLNNVTCPFMFES